MFTAPCSPPREAQGSGLCRILDAAFPNLCEAAARYVGVMTARLTPLMAGTGLVLAAVIAAIVLNVLLLARASSTNGPLGRLSPSGTLPPAPAWTIRPLTGRPTDRGADD